MENGRNWLAGVGDAVLDLSDLPVKTSFGDDLGTVDGLIVDADGGRPYYVVVDAGGWFQAKHFLVPIGQVRLTPERDGLLVLLTKDQIRRFPGFDCETFLELSETEIQRLHDDMLAVCEPGTTSAASDDDHAPWPASFRVPEWWSDVSSQRDVAQVVSEPSAR